MSIVRKTGAMLLTIMWFACSGLFAQQQPAQVGSQGGGSSAGGEYTQFVVVGGEPVASHLTSNTWQGQVGFLYRSFNTLVPTFAVSGNIVTPEGTALAEGTVSLLKDDNGTKTKVSEVTIGADGSFLFAEVYTGAYTLQVVPVTPVADSLLLLKTYLGGVQLPQDAEVFTLTADKVFANLAVLREAAPEQEWTGESVVSGILVEDNTGGSDGGRLLSGLRTNAGTPMVNAQVFLTDPLSKAIKFTEVTDAEGRFRFSNIASRTYGFMVEYEGETFEMAETLTVDENSDAEITAVITDGQVNGTVDQITGIEEDAAQGIQLYPNPVRDQLRLQLQSLSPGRLRIQLFDQQGRMLQAKVAEVAGSSLTEELDFAGLPQGLYLLIISQQDRLIKRKVIKE